MLHTQISWDDSDKVNGTVLLLVWNREIAGSMDFEDCEFNFVLLPFKFWLIY